MTEGAVVDSFKIIYRILRILERSMDLEEFDKENISHERLGISEARWCRLMAMLVAGGYTTGIEVWNSMDQSYPRVALTRPPSNICMTKAPKARKYGASGAFAFLAFHFVGQIWGKI